MKITQIFFGGFFGVRFLGWYQVLQSSMIIGIEREDVSGREEKLALDDCFGINLAS